MSIQNSTGHPWKAGFHTHIGKIALGDVVGTLLIVWAIVYWTHWDFSLVAAVAFFLAFVLHRLFCIRSKN